MSISVEDQAHQTRAFCFWTHFPDEVPPVHVMSKMRIQEPEKYDYFITHPCSSALQAHVEIDLGEVAATLPSQIRRVALHAGELALAG